MAWLLYAKFCLFLGDNFYDALGSSPPEYDNALNQQSDAINPQEQAVREQEWRSELAKVKYTLLEVLCGRGEAQINGLFDSVFTI